MGNKLKTMLKEKPPPEPEFFDPHFHIWDNENGVQDHAIINGYGGKWNWEEQQNELGQVKMVRIFPRNLARELLKLFNLASQKFFCVTDPTVGNLRWSNQKYT